MRVLIKGRGSSMDMLDRIVVDDAVWGLRPDFAVLVMTVQGLANGPSDDGSMAWLAAAGEQADPGEPHIAAWRDAYRAFGAKPSRTRPSVDALVRRADRLPAINRVVDAYNAISVGHALPIGGEDLDAYSGPARLTVATGAEPFDDEPPAPGEVVWRDDEGVTCRRWNWRQCVRTRITESTTNALFILERLEPYPLDRLDTAADSLLALLRTISPGLHAERRLILPS
jgi:DNA/RNA-binding domain of Phe-tRNA-synthetase-like protein